MGDEPILNDGEWAAELEQAMQVIRRSMVGAPEARAARRINPWVI